MTLPVCPLMSAVHNGQIVSSNCLGNRCAFYVEVRGADGAIVDGACSVKVLAVEAFQHGQRAAQVASAPKTSIIQ